jgi:hypothetical protein
VSDKKILITMWMFKLETHVRHVLGKVCGWEKTFEFRELKLQGKAKPNLRTRAKDLQPQHQSWSATFRSYERNTVPSENNSV